MRKLLFLIFLTILPLAAMADNVGMTKTLTYHFTGVSDDRLVSNNPRGGDEKALWTAVSSYHYWSDRASAVGAHCNYNDYLYTRSLETFPEVIQKVTVNAGAWSDVSTSLRLNNREVSLKTIRSSAYAGNESRIQFADYVFENVSTSDKKGHLFLEYILSGQADIFIRSITVEYVEGAECDMSEIPTSNAFYAATSFLCERGVLDGSRDDGKYSVGERLLRKHLANITFRGLFTLNGREIPSTFVSDQYPAIYKDLKSDAPYYQAAKTLLYLDYGDGITPFDRDRDGFFPDGYESRINILKELMEAFNIKPDTEGKDNPFPNDPGIAQLSETSPIRMGYVRRAAKLGIITTENTEFHPFVDCLRGEAFLMLARIIQKIEAGEIADPNPQKSDFLDPNSGTGTVDPNAEPYAVLSNNNTVLTFYYDGKKESRGGLSVGPFTTNSVPSWYWQRESITSVIFDASFANCTTLTSTAKWFDGLQNLSSIKGISNLKTDNVIDMNGMFAGCTSLKSLDVAGFKTDNVTNMNNMFYGCSGLTSLDVTGFKTDNVMDMGGMFSGCSGLTSLDVTGFKTDNVMNMYNMFGGCSGLTSLNVTGFKTDKVTSVAFMFSSCSGLTSLDVTGFKTDNVLYMAGMFSSCSGLTSLDVTGFKTDNVTNMRDMFRYCSGLASLDVTGFKTDNVTNMEDMFYGCSGLMSLDVTGFKTDNVTNMGGMFGFCSRLTNLDVTNFETDNVECIAQMFNGCSGLTSLDLTGFKTDKVTKMNWMFRDCSSLKTIYAGGGWSTEKVQGEDGKSMFSGCSKLVGGAGTTYNANHTDHAYARIDGGADNPGYFTDKNATPTQSADPEPYAVLTDNDDEITTDGGTVKGKTLTFYYDNQKEDRSGMSVVFSSSAEIGWGFECERITRAVFDGSFANCTTLTSTKWWFLFCKNLKTITGITNLKTDNVTDMTGMFYGCRSLTSLDLSSLNTSSLKSMFGIFQDCFGLKSINLTNFITDKVEEMGQLFLNCSSLESLDLSGFKTDRVSSMFNMFRGCSNLTTVFVGSNWSTEAVSQSMGMFQNCTSLVGGAGTAYDANHIGHTYAHIDGGTSNPGYFTAKADADLDGDGKVDETDVTMLVSVVMGGDKNKLADADLNHDGKVDIADVVMLVNIIKSQKK